MLEVCISVIIVLLVKNIFFNLSNIYSRSLSKAVDHFTKIPIMIPHNIEKTPDKAHPTPDMKPQINTD